MNTKLKVGIVVVLVAVLGGTGYAFGIFKVGEKPTQTLATSYAVMHKDMPDSIATVHVVLKKKKQASESIYSDLGDVKLVVSKKVDRKDISNSSADVIFTGKTQISDENGKFSEVEASGDILVAQKMLYAKLTTVPLLPFLPKDELLGKWWNIDAVKIADDLGGPALAKEVKVYVDRLFNATSFTNNKEIADTFEKYNFITNPTILGNEKIAGHEVVDISFVLDKTVFMNFVNALIANDSFRHDNNMSDEDVLSIRTNIKSLLDTTNMTPVVVGIGKDNHYLYALKTKVELVDPNYVASDPTSFQVMSIDTSIAYDYTTPFEIAVPKDTTPFETVLQKLLATPAN